MIIYFFVVVGVFEETSIVAVTSENDIKDEKIFVPMLISKSMKREPVCGEWTDLYAYLFKGIGKDLMLG